MTIIRYDTDKYVKQRAHLYSKSESASSFKLRYLDYNLPAFFFHSVK